jgi:cytochrome c-type biogenesis protein CcmH
LRNSTAGRPDRTRVTGTFLAAGVVALWLAPALFAADLEQEARAIDELLVAPCCFSQQVSIHRSAAADEVKRDVRSRLAAGETRRQILDAYVSQYGKRILAEPPAVGFDLMLYVTPFLMLVASSWAVTIAVRRFSHSRLAASGGSLDDAASAMANPELEARLDDELRDLD